MLTEQNKIKLSELTEDVRFDEPMRAHTTFRVGGNAEAFVNASSSMEIVAVRNYCAENEIPCICIGNGSNILVGDEGIKGVVISIGSGMSEVQVVDNMIYAEAGALMSKVAAAALKAELSGFESLSGIPGSIGGAVFMNAGAYGGETKDCLESAMVLTRNGVLKKYSNSDLKFSYRHSYIQETDEIVVSATFKLKKGDKSTILDEMNYLNALRQYKQPLEYPSCGSVFKRPTGHFVGPMIIEAGLQGKQIGGAQVSMKHAGFIVNKGGATATDYLNLIHYIQKTIKEKDDIDLHTEVRIIGEDKK